MDTLSIILPASRPKALSLLLNQVLGGGDAVLIVEGDAGPALLDEAASQLAARRYRVLRAAAAGPGGLSPSGLMAQVVGQPDLAAQDDALLELGFRMLTVPDPTCAGIVLLVSGAEALQRKTLRYIQFACEAGASLRLVLAGEPGLMEVLGWEAADFLHARLGSRPVIAVEGPDPAAALPGLAVRNAVVEALSAGRPRQGRILQSGPVASTASRARWLAGGAVLGLAVVSGVAAVALGVRPDRQGWPALGPGPAVIDGAATGAATAVTQASPNAASPSEIAPSKAAPVRAALAPAAPVRAASPDRTVRADPVAPPPTAQDAPARPTLPVTILPAPASPKEALPALALQATDAAPGRSANPSRTIPPPDSASPPAPASSPAQNLAAQGAPATQLAPATATAGIAAVPDRPAPPSHAAAALPDEAVAASPMLPRFSRRAASQQPDAPAKEAQPRDAQPREVQHGAETPQEAPRRESVTTAHSPTRTVSLRPRAAEDRASDTRDDLPLPPPFARRPHHAAPRPVPFAFRLPDPEPSDPEPVEPVREPEVRAQPYIGTFGLDSNGQRSFHPGQ